MDTKSKWSEIDIKPFPKLTSSKNFEVIIIGGGITGITTAYLLSKHGIKVGLIEREKIGGVDSSHTTAHLTCLTDLRLSKLARNFGKKTAKTVWEAGQQAIAIIEKITREEKIDCELKRVSAYLLSSLIDEQNIKDLKNDADLANELGFEAEYLSAIPYFNKEGIEFPGQGLFHPLKFIAALAEIIKAKGGEIFEKTEIEEFVDGSFKLKAGNHIISADYVVIATHDPLAGNVSLLPAAFFQTKLALYSTYVVSGRISSGVIPEGSYFDLHDPYNYLRVEKQGGFDYAILGGEDHKTGQTVDTKESYNRLERKFFKLFPETSIDHRWSGQVIETHDGLPYIGETAERQFVATGFAGNGMTFGVISALMAVDSILGRENPYNKIFKPDRFKVIGGAVDYIKENVSYPYYALKDRITPPAAKDLDSITPGEGKIINFNGKRAACYCDESGHITCLSAVCTHMGGIVHWNNAEKTWDCPCHGSRFHKTGEVMSGPAETPLETLAGADNTAREPAKEAR
jgi:glycine/D-amino acid oxidase-like deaminating enzyme/nitrite reductase/ring-hydroxylating ferredoxin subunit